MGRSFTRFLLGVLLILVSVQVFSQGKVLKGVVKDMQSDEPIPFASVVLKNSGFGTLSDSAGTFSLTFSTPLPDTLLVTSVGYKPIAINIPTFAESTSVTILMTISPVGNEAVVKVKFNRALWFWNKIIANKKKHDPAEYKSFSYEVYNKLELDLININKEKLSNNKLLKPFSFIFDNVDTTEDKPFLPVFLTETISDFHLQHSPKRTKEVIKASKTNGVNNESVTKLLGATYQNVNVYSNFLPVFDKQFVSPLHDKGDNYYNFKLLDTQYLNNKRLIHLRFVPKRRGENTFEGDCWVHDSTYAIQKITLRPSADANLNFVQNLTMIQEYRLINDTTWFLAKDKFVVDISPLENSKGGFKGRKTSTYKNVLLNDSSTEEILKKNKKQEEVEVASNSELHAEEFWSNSRHEELSRNEKNIYKMIDSIQSSPAYQKYYNTIYFLSTGLKDVGNYEIGPWYNWISANSLEGTRLRFDLATNTIFDKKIRLHGYLAYGFLDKQFKGKADIFYLPKKNNPRTYFYASYLQDLDQGQQYYDEISTDNVFSLAIRKIGVPVKFQFVKEKRFEAFQELNNGLSFLLAVTSKEFDPLRNLPDKSFFDQNISGDPLKSFETSLRLRYAYLEKFIESTFYRTSLGSTLPIVELKYTKGWSGVFRSSYNYSKLNASVSDYMQIAPYGNLYYSFFAGKVFGTLPYTLLEVHPGNEIYYYNKYAFNMMNRFEYISDKYSGFNVEHNIGNGLFRYIPLTRKLKLRQFWSAKGVWGNLSEENKKLNFVGTQTFQSLNDKMYLELGTGVDNILKVLRLDFVWRVLPTPLPKEQNKRFGIFGSFRVAF
ncbi:MAG TPA: DUF5686 family protein [Segetibacter sp.]|jgi:hypothetical protein